jgi:hypothetical protein
MQESDLYFTHTIVGAPVSVILGVRVTLPKTSIDGVEVSLSQSHHRVSQAWQDWLMLQPESPATGQPRVRPGRSRRWLLRYSMVLALLGLASLAAAGGLAAWLIWLLPQAL